MTELEKLQAQLRACRHCEGMLEPRPVVHGNPGAPILQVSQAPGKKVHETGIPSTTPPAGGCDRTGIRSVMRSFMTRICFISRAWATAIREREKPGTKSPRGAVLICGPGGKSN